MKKLMTFCAILMLTLQITGCGSNAEFTFYDVNSVLNYCDDSTKDIFSRNELPKTMVIEEIGENYSTKTISDQALIQETMDAIREMDIVCEVNEDTQDSSETFIFTMENGDCCMISFWRSDLETQDATFATSQTDAFSHVRSKILKVSK